MQPILCRHLPRQRPGPCAHVTDLLQRRAADLDRRIRELQQLCGELQQLAERATAFDPDQCPPERVCQIIA